MMSKNAIVRDRRLKVGLFSLTAKKQGVVSRKNLLTGMALGL